MRRRMVTVSIFLCTAVFVFLFSQTISSPFYFLSSFFASPRAALYKTVYAQKSSSELDLLRLENTKLKEQLQEMNTLKKDNAALRSQFEDTTFPSQTLIPAQIIGFKGSLQNPTEFILDQGAKSGVKKGAPVVLGNQLVGKISQVNQYFSEVILTVNKDFTALAVSGTHDSPGIVMGFDEFMVLDHVTITDTLSKDEVVFTKGEVGVQGLGIPPNLIIGKITRVNKSDTQPLQSATVESMITFNSLSTVFIVKQ